MTEKWKYKLWCEAGLLHECDGFDSEEEAEEEAKADLDSYYDYAETETLEGEYWYETESYEEEVDEDE